MRSSLTKENQQAKGKNQKSKIRKERSTLLPFHFCFLPFDFLLSTANRIIGQRHGFKFWGVCLIGLLFGAMFIRHSHAIAPDLIIRTPAGSGVYGLAGDNGPAPNARLSTPTGV